MVSSLRLPAAIVMLVAVMASSCVATQRTPPETVLRGLRTITIVPIEAPPLLLHPKNDADRAAIAAVGLASPGSTAGADPRYLLPLPLFGAVGAVGTVLIYGIVSSTPRAGETATMVKGSPPWMPTTGLARVVSQGEVLLTQCLKDLGLVPR